jgi:hypothetical protein
MPAPADPADTLDRIRQRLERQHDPLAVIEELSPRTLTEALRWARLRPVWDEYRGLYPEQVIGVAAVLGRRAMREFGLTQGGDGRVRHARPEGRAWQTPGPSLRFEMAVAGQPVRVEYTQDYFPTGTDHFAFVSPHAPARPHPLSESGYRSHFALPEAVEACGGPEGYAARFAEARLAGREKEFEAAFEGRWPEANPPRHRRESRPEEMPAVAGPSPVVGGHTAAIAGERREDQSKSPPVQKTLF